MRRCPCESEGIFVMGYIQGEGRSQGTLFPVVLDDLISTDHMCRVIDAFVDRLEMAKLGFVRAEAADTGVLAMIRETCSSCICTAICTRYVRRED
jgi:hypothetical protein